MITRHQTLFNPVPDVFPTELLRFTKNWIDNFRYLHNYMVVHSLNDAFAALADPTRRAMLDRLAQGPASVSDLGKPFNLTQQAVSKHVAVLKNAGFVTQERRGRLQECRMNPQMLEQTAKWLEQRRTIWEDRVDRLADLVETNPRSKRKNAKRKHP